MNKRLWVLSLVITFGGPLQAEGLQDLLANLQQQVEVIGSASEGELFWMQESATGRSCSQCHGTDISMSGRHITTKKMIEPMAPSVISNRLTDPDKVKKWLERNCRWTLGRSCSASEQLNVLTWLSQQ